MNTYPSFVPPGSGSAFTQYPFANITNHLGVDDYMTWDTTKAPSSFYHPYYLHNIHDGLTTLRDPATAASIEMGIGKHLVDVVKFANGNNLGNNKTRVGVSYFNYLKDIQNIVVNNDAAIMDLSITNINVSGGYFGIRNIGIYWPSSSFLLNGNSYLDAISIDANGTWSFNYGNIRSQGPIRLFNNSFNIFSEGSGVLNTTHSINFNGSILSSDVLLTRGLVSSTHDTYSTTAAYDTSVVYSVNGHSHDASGWSASLSTQTINNTVTFDGIYYYTIGSNSIIRLDSTSSDGTWTNTTNDLPTIYNDILSKTTIISKNLLNNIGFLINNNKIVIDINKQQILYNDEIYKLDSSTSILDDVYIIDNNFYYVQTIINTIYIHRFNGKVWKKWKYNFNNTCSFITTCVSNNEIFIIAQINNTKITVVKFSMLGIFKIINNFNSYGKLNKVSILDHDMLCLYDMIDYKIAYIYSLNNPKYIQKLFNNINYSITSISLYNDSIYNYAHVGDMRKRILRNKSMTLSIDSIGGIYNFKNNINIKGSVTTNSPINAITKQSIYKNINSIHTNKYILEPEKAKDDSFSTSFINRYLYNNTLFESPVYNDLTSIIFYNNSYFIGHRGSITIFNKNNNNVLESKAVSLGDVIVSKFMALDNYLYALVQDFTNASVDFISEIPESPLAADSEIRSNLIPFVPVKWSNPFTKLYKFSPSKLDWNEDINFTNTFGRNIIDSISYDNSLYILSHDNSGSGIVSYKYSVNDISISGKILDYTGSLNLNESLTANSNVILSGFIQNKDGSFKISNNTYEKQAIIDLNGFHEFYLYNHAIGPYVVHDQIETLYNYIAPNSIIPSALSPDVVYTLKNTGIKYNYRTLTISFLNTNAAQVYSNIGYNSLIHSNLNTSVIKIPIILDNGTPITNDLDKYNIKTLSDNSFNNRDKIHFITSITFNKNIYLLMQVNTSINIYCIKDFNNHLDIVDNAIFNSESPTAIHDRNVKTTTGIGMSYIGVPTGLNYINSKNIDHDSHTFLDFIPTDIQNVLIASIDITNIISNKSSIYVLGDNDDLYIQKPKSKNYRHNKRYGTSSNMIISSNLYLPITCRVNYPYGELYTFVLGFFADGSVGIVGNNNNSTEMVYRPMGRSQITYSNGKYLIATIKMQDEASTNITYDELQQIVWKSILDTIPQNYSDMYNMIAKKQWVIGEYDIKVEDNLNIRESL